MKVNNANLQVYSHALTQRQQAPPATESKVAEPNKFGQAKFADLLTLQEKKFILQNFKPDSTQHKSDSHLGKVVDIRA